MIITVSVDNPIYFNTIDEAINKAADNDIIHVYPGVYKERLNINKELTILGIGNKDNIKIIDSNTKYENTIFILEKTSIENVTIESEYGNAIHIFTAMDVLIKNCNVISIKGRAISIIGSSDFIFKNCFIKSPDLCIFYDSHFDIGGKVTDSKIECDYGYCIRIIKNGIITFIGCDFVNNSNHCTCICNESIIKIKNCNFYKKLDKDNVLFLDNALNCNAIYL